MSSTTMEDLYPSRVDLRPKSISREDPVVYGNLEKKFDTPFSKEQLKFFDRNGFLFLEEFFSLDEIENFRGEMEMLRSSDRLKDRPEVVTEPGSGEVRSVFKIHELSDLFRALSCDERLVGSLAQILDSELYIHQSRVNLKPGFAGKEFYWHSDFETWHVEDGLPRMRAVSCSIALTDNNPFNGPLMVIPGSHKEYIACVGKAPDNHFQQSLKRQEYGVPDKESLARMAEERGIEAPTGKAGSVLLFDCNLMHGSNSNISPWPRSNVFFVYNSIENAPANPFGGTKPRPDYLAARENITPLRSQRPDYRKLLLES